MKDILLGIGAFWFGCTVWITSTRFIDHETDVKWYIAWGGANIILWILFFLQSVYQIHLQQHFSKIAFTILFCTTTQALYGIYQCLNNHSGFITGSFDNPAGLASLLAFTLPFGCYGCTVRKTKLKFCAISGTLILCLSLLLTESRAGILCGIIIFFLYFLRIIHFYRKKMIFIGGGVLICSSIFLYQYKKESADGRLLIWKCTCEMIKDQPWNGFGTNGFQTNYMNYQADFFRQHPNHCHAILADNIKHPFNEFLLLTVSYGFIGIICLFIIIILLVHAYRKNNGMKSYTVALCLVAIAVFSLFSYPFRYPHTWILCIFSTIILCSNAYKISLYIRKTLILITALYVTIRSILYIPYIKAEMKWAEISNRSLCGMTEEMLPTYDILYDRLTNNPLFLYNHAAELNIAKQYEKSMQISLECEKIFADYYLQLLIADNYKQMKQYKQATTHLIQASFMCPNRFVPLYELFKIYEIQQDRNAMTNIGYKILQKRIKVESTEVKQIIMEVKHKIEKDS